MLALGLLNTTPQIHHMVLTYRDSDMVITSPVISHVSAKSQTGDMGEVLPDD